MRLFLFIIMFVIMMLFPISIFQLPDDWILEGKSHLRNVTNRVIHNVQSFENSVNNNQISKNEDHINSKIKIHLPKHHVTITLGDSKEKIEKILGQPKDEVFNEYQNVWKVYHQNFHHMLFIMYENNQVVALYSNQSNIEINGIKLGTNRNKVNQALSVPLKTFIGPTYQLKLSDKFSTIHKVNQTLINVYYDRWMQNRVSGIKIEDQHIEKYKPFLFQSPSVNLQKGFRKMNYYLINSSRVMHQLHPLKFDSKSAIVAGNHAKDMAVHQYFNHINLKGASPFERSDQAGVTYQFAGENLATGQQSAIEAHHGLMNSKGHRKNILNPRFKQVGIGVYFNQHQRPFFVENYRN